MRQIYRQCSEVRIWLGCDMARCNLQLRDQHVSESYVEQHDPFELIRNMSSGQHMHDWPCFIKPRDDEDFLIYRQTETFDCLWDGLCKIAQCAWWTRMWTVQELLLPRSGTLMYDTWTMPLEAITKCGDSYYERVWGCCRAASLALPKTISQPLDEHCTTFYTISHDRNGLADHEYFDIQEQHLSYGHRHCQNPRDKIYGLLGLVGDISDLDLWLTPDYTASVQGVYYDATCAMLYRGIRDLKCLTGSEYGPAAGKWASWVRDFGTPLDRTDADISSNWLMTYELFDAAGGRKSSYEKYMVWPFSPDEKPHQLALGVTARCVGVVSSICQTSGTELDSEDEVQQERTKYKTWIEAAGLDCKTLAAGHEHSTKAKQFWRMILGGTMSIGTDSDDYSDWRRFDSEALTWLQPFSTWVENGQPDLQFSLDRTLSIATHKRSYFGTQSGSQGLCYPTSKVGDQVWVIDGSRVPFVLRHIDLNTDGEDETLRPMEAYVLDADGEYGVKDDYKLEETPFGHFELIGDCYLDDFMDGEACDDAMFPPQLILLV